MIVCSYVSDDNECESELNLCTNGRCNNLEGSFECKCDPGYELSPTGDECNGKMNETIVKENRLHTCAHFHFSVSRWLL